MAKSMKWNFPSKHEQGISGWVIIDDDADTTLLMSYEMIINAMTCKNCGTIERYGKRADIGRKLCIDCWKTKEPKSKVAKNSSGDLD
ncbi:MAG: hypothetical protein ACTSV2_19355 [Candidatus Thorarchaeota archaeon]